MITDTKVFEKWITFYCIILLNLQNVVTILEIPENSCTIFSNEVDNQSLFLTTNEQNINAAKYKNFMLEADEALKISILHDCLFTICGFGTYIDHAGLCHSYTERFNSENQNDQLQYILSEQVTQSF